jgi:hypothetical protein
MRAMSRKRTSTAPPKLRAKLDTAEEINLELKRTYRLFINKQITHADMTRRKELLVALRAGLPDPVERPKVNGYVPPAIHVFSVPSGCFLSPAQIEAQQRGEPFVDIDQCTPILPEQEQALLEHAPQSEPEELYKAPAVDITEPPLDPEPDDNVRVISAGLRARRAARIRDEVD